MGVLTICISDTEKAALARRARSEGTTPSGPVRRLIREKPLVPASDLLAEMDSLMGDKRLSVKRRK